MSNRKALGLLMAVVCLSAAACSSATDEAESYAGSSNDELNASRSALWPVKGGRATIEVCWLPPWIQANFAVSQLAPAPSFVYERQAWVREIVEREWNAKTRLRFVGWGPCATASSQAVRLLPMDSIGTSDCGDQGQPCTQALGKFERGRIAFLNLFFGDEFIYTSQYRQLSGATYDKKLDVKQMWIPAACLDAFDYPWVTNAKDAAYRLDMTKPDVLAKAMAIFQPCLQNNILHEFGHIAGFAHEQYRTDDPRARRECLQRGGLADDLAQIPAESRGDKPLGPFDFESIMSYCRTDDSPTLTAEDIAMTNRAYRH